MTTTRDMTCKERVRQEYRDEMRRIRELWELYKRDPEATTEDGQCWNEYGLSFDYVAPGTFNGQRRGYFRYQISWGGPSDEFRFFTDESLHLTSVQYWFMDWYDGAHVCVNGADRQLWEEVWADWLEVELPQSKMEDAKE